MWSYSWCGAAALSQRLGAAADDAAYEWFFGLQAIMVKESQVQIATSL